MTTMRKVAWLLWVILSGYVVMWTFGLILGLTFMFFILTGRIRIHGYWNLIRAALKGRTMILTNHPTLFFETFGMGALLFPWFLIVPWCFVWSIPDKRLLDSWNMPGWLRTALRCTEVNRSKRMSGGRGGLKAKEVLRMRGIIVGHPEQGRTFGEANARKSPLVRGNRQMQEIGASLLTQIAYEAKASILPGWIEVSDKEPVSLLTSFKRMFGSENKKYRPVIYHFGRPYRPSRPFDLARENEKLQKEVFDA